VKELKETRPTWTPPQGLGSSEPNLEKQITCVCVNIALRFNSSSPLSQVLLLAIVLSWLTKLSALIEKLIARRTTLPHYNFIYTCSNAKLRRSLCSKLIIFRFRLFTPSWRLSEGMNHVDQIKTTINQIMQGHK
jgi:hypothetical protein